MFLDEFHLRQHHWYIDALRAAGLAYHELHGSPEQRLQTALSLIEKAGAGQASSAIFPVSLQ